MRDHLGRPGAVSGKKIKQNKTKTTTLSKENKIIFSTVLYPKCSTLNKNYQKYQRKYKKSQEKTVNKKRHLGSPETNLTDTNFKITVIKIFKKTMEI